MNDIHFRQTEIAAARSSCSGSKTSVLHFKVKNTPLQLKDKKMEKESSKEVQFSFCGGMEAFHQEIVCFEMQPRQWSFCWIFRYILYSMVKKSTFLKGNLCIYKCFRDVSYIFSSAPKKNYKMRPDLRWILRWIFALCSADFTTGSPRSKYEHRASTKIGIVT